MLLFNPILSQSRVTQSLYKISLPSSVGAPCARKYPTRFYFLICNTENEAENEK